MAQFIKRLNLFFNQLLQTLRQGGQSNELQETGLPTQKNQRYFT